MSQQNALALMLSTPPTSDGCDHNIKDVSLKNESNTEEASPQFSPSQQTPSMVNSQHNSLEPPAWKPPDTEEIEYTDAWNNIYNNQHHYLQPGLAQDDSTIGSSQTNNSMTNNISICSSHLLRPRGLSLCSYADDPSVGSCPQPSQRGHGQHRRHPSLPVSFFPSASQQGSNQQLFTPPQKGSQNQVQTSKQYLHLLQSTTKSAPYELHSHLNASQVQADGAMAGLRGILLDLYMVDRTVDSATAKILATREEHGPVRAVEDEKGDGILRKESQLSSSRKPRKTSVGTLNDIQCILELHKVDKIVDRFKQDLQMPEFFEEEACESDVWKDLRRTDVDMEEYARKKKSKGNIRRRQHTKENSGMETKGKNHHHFDLGGDDKEVVWNHVRQELGAEDIDASAESFLIDDDAYQFFDPHETDVLRANCYQSSQVSASIHDNLHEVIDMLRTDVEVNGASKYQNEMEMIRPLLEIDREMNKCIARSEVKNLWDEDLRPLYLTDLQVEGATRKCAPKPHQSEAVNRSADLEGKTAGNKSVKVQDPMSPVHATKQSAEEIIIAESTVEISSISVTEEQNSLYHIRATKSSTDQEVKEMLSQHITQLSQPFCPTSPELVASKATVQAAVLTLSPTAPTPSLEQSTRRAIFSTREKSNAKMMHKATSTKRSIFSRQEKSSAKSQCAFQRGIMMLGTTTVVMARGGEMIDDIPVGKVVITDVVGGTAIR